MWSILACWRICQEHEAVVPCSKHCCSLLPAGLFSDLDTHSHLGVISYGVSMTTLEDVYLKLEVEAEIDQAGGTAHGTFLISLVFGMLSVSGAVSHGRWEEVCCRGRS